MAGKTTKIQVPKESGDELTFRFAGEDPETYKVTDDHITVPNERVDAVLTSVSGSSIVEATSASTPGKGA